MNIVGALKGKSADLLVRRRSNHKRCTKEEQEGKEGRLRDGICAKG